MTSAEHTPFRLSYIWSATLLSLTAGFALGAHVAFTLGFGLPLQPGLMSFIQVHGHVQLLGWAGLFVIGVSLYFFPRLSHNPIGSGHRERTILVLVTTGLIFRTMGQLSLPYLSENTIGWGWIRGLLVTGAGLEWLGVTGYVAVLLWSLRISDPKARLEKLKSVRPLLLGMFAGWMIYITVQVYLVFNMATTNALTTPWSLTQWSNNVFTWLVLLPVCFAVSIRTFPLYLRLPIIRWNTARFGAVYVVLILMADLLTFPSWKTPLLTTLHYVLMIVTGVLVIWFVLRLDVLTHRQLTWTHFRSVTMQSHRRRPREHYPDYGEWGYFERLVYSAYTWLVLGIILEIIRNTGYLTGAGGWINPDASRHMILFGFVTLLIFGMAVRMIPGFLKIKEVRYPGLVNATFWLGNLAVICRVVPVLINRTSLADPGQSLLDYMYGISGISGLVAAALLGWNLWQTSRLRNIAP